MSSEGYAPPPSGSFSRSPSIDPTKHISYTPQPPGPNFSSVLTGHSDPQLTAVSQRSFPSHQPSQAHVRPVLNSSNQLSETRGLDFTPSTTGGQAPGFSGLGPHNPSANAVTGGGATEQRPPTISNLAERDRSNNGGDKSGEGESESEVINPQDYVGISLVGPKFKQVNPEAYYVAKDDDPYY